MTFKLPDDLSAVKSEDLDGLLADAIEAYGPLAKIDDLTDEQLAELESLAAAVDAIRTEGDNRATATQDRLDRAAAAKAKLDSAEEAPAAPAAEAEPETPEADAVEPEAEDEATVPVEEEPVMASGKPSVVKRAAGRVAEPDAPEAVEETVSPKFTLIAAGDVRGFSAGQEMKFDELTEAFGRKLAGLSDHAKVVRTDKFALAEMQLHTPEETTIGVKDSPEVASQKIKNAIFARYGAATPFGRQSDELESLVAAGDWGAPSQIIYDIPIIEQAPDGLLNLPSITVERGGFQHTLGIDFSVITGDVNFGFTQTEAQAAAKTVKPFISPTNPTFQDERLKVLGYGMEVGILTLKGYPELIKRYTQGTATAFAHYRNKDTITRMLSYFPATASAIAATAVGSIVDDTLDMLSFYAERTRYQYSLQEKQGFEVVIPAWVKGVFREDLDKRSGWDSKNVQDAYIENLFSQRNLNVTWLKDWTGQDLAAAATGWPTSSLIGMYLPGTFVKGGGPVVSYDAVVDYAHISTNTIVQLFREESTLVAQMLNVAPLLFSIPTGTAYERQGRTGKYDLGAEAINRTYA